MPGAGAVDAQSALAMGGSQAALAFSKAADGKAQSSKLLEARPSRRDGFRLSG